MLAVGYLIGVLDLQRIWKSQRREPASTLRDPPAERVDRAVITLGRYGPLSRGDTSSDAPVPELASTEALALIAYFARHSVPTHVVVGSDQAPQALHVLLEEGERATRAPRLPSAQLGRAETARSLRIGSAKLSAPSHQPSGESLARVKTGEVSTSRTAAFLISCGDGPAKACPRGIYVSVCKRCAL